jgi:hypothetical protein
MHRPRALAGLHALLHTLLRAGAWALVAAAALTGCSDLGEPIRLSAHAELSVASLDFGTVAVSGSATRSVIVGNSGGADLHGSASVACSNYSIQSGGPAAPALPTASSTWEWASPP